MRRRTILTSSLAALAALSIPGRRVFAAGTADVTAIGLDGKPLTLKGGDLDDLRATVRGEVLTADQSGWDTARRLWNPVFDKKPALIVRCVGAADVRSAVKYAAGARTADRGPRRRPQPLGPVGLRWRNNHRSLAHALRRSRSHRENRARRGRGAPRAARP
jgi:hypothetical protein